jgi:glyoxylase-like metal-dependent hydrolase (beta-lactamase superfamily II)
VTVASLGQGARVGQYTSIPWGFSTNSYWVEGPRGVVLIDTQFLPSAAEELLRYVAATTGKRVTEAVVLHPNPDKFNGAERVRAHGGRVVSSDAVRADIAEVHRERKASFFKRYTPDYAADAPEVEAVLGGPESFAGSGLTLRMHALHGGGCSRAHAVVEWDGHVFVGDLVGERTHAWLELGLVDEWLARLDEIEALRPKFVHPGRGRSGGVELLAAQRKYLLTAKEAVLSERPARLDDEAGIARAKAKILAAYPDYDFSVFLDIGLPAVWNRYVNAPVRSP